MASSLHKWTEGPWEQVRGYLQEDLARLESTVNRLLAASTEESPLTTIERTVTEGGVTPLVRTAGVAILISTEDDASALIAFGSGFAAVIVSDPASICSAVEDNAGTLNIVYFSGTWMVQNLRGTTRSLVAHILTA